MNLMSSPVLTKAPAEDTPIEEGAYYVVVKNVSLYAEKIPALFVVEYAITEGEQKGRLLKQFFNWSDVDITKMNELTVEPVLDANGAPVIGEDGEPMTQPRTNLNQEEKDLLETLTEIWMDKRCKKRWMFETLQKLECEEIADDSPEAFLNAFHSVIGEVARVYVSVNEYNGKVYENVYVNGLHTDPLDDALASDSFA